MRLKQHSRRLVALEMLFLTLCPLVLIPEARKDKQVISETLEDLEELKECYGNLGMQDISSLTSTKKAKKGEPDKQQKHQEAQRVLIDFLTSLLTKP